MVVRRSQNTNTPPPWNGRRQKTGELPRTGRSRTARADFHDKCYLCEMDELQSVEVEHLRPIKGTKI